MGDVSYRTFSGIFVQDCFNWEFFAQEYLWVGIFEQGNKWLTATLIYSIIYEVYIYGVKKDFSWNPVNSLLIVDQRNLSLRSTLLLPVLDRIFFLWHKMVNSSDISAELLLEDSCLHTAKPRGILSTAPMRSHSWSLLPTSLIIYSGLEFTIGSLMYGRLFLVQRHVFSSRDVTHYLSFAPVWQSQKGLHERWEVWGKKNYRPKNRPCEIYAVNRDHWNRTKSQLSMGRVIKIRGNFSVERGREQKSQTFIRSLSKEDTALEFSERKIDFSLTIERWRAKEKKLTPHPSVLWQSTFKKGIREPHRS